MDNFYDEKNKKIQFPPRTTTFFKFIFLLFVEFLFFAWSPTGASAALTRVHFLSLSLCAGAVTD